MGEFCLRTKGRGGEGGLYLITLFFCWIAPSSRAIYYLDSFSPKELWKEQVGKGQSCRGNIFLKEKVDPEHILDPLDPKIA